MRLAALVLVVLAASLYISPLHAFFAAQDGYFAQLAALTQAQAANRILVKQIAVMRSEAYIVRQAREQYQLVPAGLQAFVVKGLPQAAASPIPGSGAPPVSPRVTLGMRLGDFWRTLRQ